MVSQTTLIDEFQTKWETLSQINKGGVCEEWCGKLTSGSHMHVPTYTSPNMKHTHTHTHAQGFIFIFLEERKCYSERNDLF